MITKHKDKLAASHTDLFFECFLSSDLQKHTLYIWFTVSICFCIISIISSRQSVPSDWMMLIPHSLAIFFVPFTMRSCWDNIISWQTLVIKFVKDSSNEKQEDDAQAKKIEKVTQFFNKNLTQFARRRKLALGFGLSFAILTTFIHWQIGFSIIDTSLVWPRIWGLFLIFLSSFFAGVAISHLFLLVGFSLKLGKNFTFDIKTHIFDILLLGRNITSCYIKVLALWSLYTSTTSWLLVQESERNDFKLLVLSLAVPTLLIITTTLVLSQYQFHIKMVEAKAEWVRELEIQRLELISLDKGDMSETKIANIDFFKQEIKRISSLPEWPISITFLGRIYSIIALPILTPFINQFINTAVEQLFQSS